MTDFEKEEFSKALTRLYDTTLEHSKQLQQVTADIQALLTLAQLHEQRLHRLEEPPSQQA